VDLKPTEHTRRVIVLSPAERIDAFTAPQLRAELDRQLSEGCSNFVIDLSGVPFLDSAGMAALVSALKRSRQVGGDVKLVWPAEEGAQRILRLTKFDRVFDIAETAQAAVARF
jgi:anti-sigma B factor antagonist